MKRIAPHLCLALLLLSGCLAHSHLPDRVSTLLDDRTTNARVEQALQGEGEELAKVASTTTNSIVTLRGSVSSPEAKQRAEIVVRGLERVKQVRNNIQVGAPAAQKR
jgi:osmotically-inducible protein OsmY